MIVGTLLAAALLMPSPPRTAFFCTFVSKSVDAKRVALEPSRDVNFLLAGTADQVGESDPIETFDPANVLEKQKFVRFVRRDAQHMALYTGDVTSERAPILLAMTFSTADEAGRGPHFVAGLAPVDRRNDRLYGFCLAMQSEDTAADFKRMNRKLESAQ